MKALAGQMETVRKAYEQEIDGVLATFEKTYQELVDNERSLKALMEQQKKEAIELSKIEVEYKPLQRAAEQNTKMYGIIAEPAEGDRHHRPDEDEQRPRARAGDRPGRAGAAEAGAEPAARAAARASAPASAWRSRSRRSTTRSRRRRTSSSSWACRCSGLVPIIGGGAGGDAVQASDNLRERDLGVFLDPKSVAAECCRSIRTNILFMSPDRPLRTMVVTSPSPQEGKTTTAINLGVTMAEAGGRVLIVDTDMRRPRLHRSFGVPNQTGISTVIVGKATLEEAIKRTDVPNLDVLPCGPVPPNPSELLHTDRFAAVLADCAQALRSHHPRLAADVRGDRSGRARQPRRRRRAGRSRPARRRATRRMHARRQLRRRQGAPVRRRRQRDRLLEPGVRLRLLLPELLPVRLHVRQRAGPEGDELTGPPVQAMATALVTGVTGQLGYYVAEQLAQRGDERLGPGPAVDARAQRQRARRRFPIGPSRATCSTSTRCSRSSRRSAPTGSSTSARRASSRRRGRSRS